MINGGARTKTDIRVEFQAKLFSEEQFLSDKRAKGVAKLIKLLANHYCPCYPLPQFPQPFRHVIFKLYHKMVYADSQTDQYGLARLGARDIYGLRQLR